IAEDVDALLREAGIAHPFVALLPGSSARHPHKRWPHFAECSHQLQAQGLRVVTIPGIDEADLGPGFAGIVLKTEGRVLNLHELAGVLKAAAIVVGNDSGPTHLAACLGTRCVAIFETDSPARISTGIDTRNAICLTAQPLYALPTEEIVSAVLRQRTLGVA
ncbi:MAG TPA: glycosyltransferase family 9 protein, partial [Lysobacter sp.]|nr:glycosyltransferase family 9 protein [Lysobacter sp.]